MSLMRRAARPPDVPVILLVCPCENWQLDVELAVVERSHPVQLRDAIEEALLEHEAECIVLAATHIAAEHA